MLREAFTRYLRNGASRDALKPLAASLVDAGFTSEGTALARHAATGEPRVDCATGTYAGRTLYVGPRPPEAAVYGDLWLDSCELSVFVLVPFYVDPETRPHVTDAVRVSIERQRSWFSLYPVRRFQFWSFLDVAPLAPARGAFDPARLAQGSELEPVTHVTCAEAGLYTYWFGTRFATETQWLSARECLNIAPWANPAREWAGESYFDDQCMVAISPDTLEIDPQSTEDVEDDALRMLYGPYAAPANVTFRNAVHMIYGLDEGDVPSVEYYAGRVLGRFRRPM